MNHELEFQSLKDSSDARGMSFSITELELRPLAGVKDVHIAAIRPGTIRGNHFHLVRAELITVVYTDSWSFHWDTGPASARHRRDFSGRGAVSVSVPTGWSHAVRNDGTHDLWLVAASDRSYDRAAATPESRDAHPRVVTNMDAS